VPSPVSRVILGKLGEAIARRELERRGYAVLATRYRTRFGEIDIVCEDDGMVVFVEVKARKTRRYGGAVETIPVSKRRRIGALALDYLAWSRQLDRPCRFDVVAIDGIGTDDVHVRVVADAFRLDHS
jgi:putative endonuclease